MHRKPPLQVVYLSKLGQFDPERQCLFGFPLLSLVHIIAGSVATHKYCRVVFWMPCYLFIHD
eukprot:m.74559 g.74559  ORF g.74559 m.74559 type:complete len:62 (-) comp12401_c0_seq2:557-742(-)